MHEPFSGGPARGPILVARVLVLSLIVALGSGCLPEWTAHPAGAPRVAAVGDSILRQLEFYGPTHPGSVHALTRSIQDAGWRASVRGENGWRIAWIRLLAADAASRGADGIIIEGGVNDVSWIHWHPRPRLARRMVVSQMRGTLDDLADVTCVVWPTIPFGRNYYYVRPRIDRISVSTINMELRRLAGIRSNLVVPEWGAAFDTHPAYAGPDGLHLSARGEAALQATLLQAMAACMRPAPAPAAIPPTTAPPSTTSPTMVPATTVPPTTVPPTTVPPTTVPATTVPPTTIPASGS
jgi:lysophospholipase L1-like esterase